MSAEAAGPVAPAAEPAPTAAKEIVQGKIRLGESAPAPSKTKVVEVIEDDGTRHQYKEGKIIACKKPGQNWHYFPD